MTSTAPTSWIGPRCSPNSSPASVIVQTGSKVEMSEAWAAPIRSVPA